MQLSKIRIRNYRLLIDAELEVDPKTTLIVGRNNTAKTSCFVCIGNVLEGKNISFNDYPLLKREDFYTKIALFMEKKLSYENLCKQVEVISIDFLVDYSLDDPDDNLGALSPFIIDVDVDTTTALIRAEYRLKTDEKTLWALLESSYYKDGAFAPNEEAHDVLADNFGKLFGLTVYAINPNNLVDKQVKSQKELHDLFPFHAIPAERVLGEDDTQNGGYISSAAIEVAELPARTGLDHMDARVTSDDGKEIQTVLQGTTYSDTEFDAVSYSYELGGETYSGTGLIPRQTVNLFSASEVYRDAVEVVSTTVDYTTLATNSYVPINFTVANQGMHVINSVTIQLDGASSQTFSGLTLLPGQSKTFSVVTKTGSEIKDLTYTVTAAFTGATTRSANGTVYLDYPDVGISALTVTKEQDGLRTVLANLYNQSAASLNKPDRRVVLGVYSDPECQTPLNGKYFTDGTTDKPYALILTGDTLAAIDGTGYTQDITFHIDDYVKDAELKEIPDSGVTLFVKAHIGQQVDGEWIVLPEADSQNNQKHLTFDSLLSRSENAPATISVEMENGSTTTAIVQVRNNSLQPCTSGNLVAALLDYNGNLLQTKNVGDLTLGAEGIEEIRIAFSKSGALVVLRYGEAVSGNHTSNANAASITIDGLPLTIGSFDENDSTVVKNVSPGQYLLTVIPEGAGATVTVNGKPVENGVAIVSSGSVTRAVTVTITAADGSTTRTYTIYLSPAASQLSGSGDCTLYFETNGGSRIAALQTGSGTTVDLTAYTPTRSGYVFTGWYADKALTEKITKVKLTGNTTVYAGWQEAASPFTDVPKGSYYEEAVNWAVAQGITTGTTATTFSPNATCTRALAVTFLWRAAGSPTPQSRAMPFTDVAADAYYADAVLWAVNEDITNGTSPTTFSPDADCTRAQIVTFIWRALAA